MSRVSSEIHDRPKDNEGRVGLATTTTTTCCYVNKRLCFLVWLVMVVVVVARWTGTTTTDSRSHSLLLSHHITRHARGFVGLAFNFNSQLSSLNFYFTSSLVSCYASAQKSLCARAHLSAGPTASLWAPTKKEHASQLARLTLLWADYVAIVAAAVVDYENHLCWLVHRRGALM